MFCYNGQYRLDEAGNPKVYMLYGHVHNTYDELLINEFQKKTRECKREVYHSDVPRNIPCHMINCFCMFSDYVPLTLDAGYPYEGSCVLFHAHSPAMPYHQHGRANTLGQAVRSIKNHDKWQLKGRPGEKRKKDFILQVQ